MGKDYLNPIASIKVISKKTGEVLQDFTGTFNEFATPKLIRNINNYFFLLSAYEDEITLERVYGNHFGVRTSCIGGLKFSYPEYTNRVLNMFMSYVTHVNPDSRGLNNAFYCTIYNYARHKYKIESYKNHSKEVFRNDILRFLNNNPCFFEVKDLNVLKQKQGVYLLVLDDYNIVYLGQSEDIKKRIMRHWSRNDYYSGPGIDVFKAFDTTRIYCALVSEKKINELEYQATKTFPKEHLFNQMPGGGIDYLDDSNIPLDEINDFSREISKQYLHELELYTEENQYYLVRL